MSADWKCMSCKKQHSAGEVRDLDEKRNGNRVTWVYTCPNTGKRVATFRKSGSPSPSKSAKRTTPAPAKPARTAAPRERREAPVSENRTVGIKLAARLDRDVDEVQAYHICAGLLSRLDELSGFSAAGIVSEGARLQRVATQTEAKRDPHAEHHDLGRDLADVLAKVLAAHGVNPAAWMALYPEALWLANGQTPPSRLQAPAPGILKKAGVPDISQTLYGAEAGEGAVGARLAGAGAGALAGAGMGSVAGPWGALAGAVVGGALGAFGPEITDAADEVLGTDNDDTATTITLPAGSAAQQQALPLRP